jgi:hypothetical protein
MTPETLAETISRLAEGGDIVTAQGYAYENLKSRTWAEKQLKNEEEWLLCKIEGRKFYVRKTATV